MEESKEQMKLKKLTDFRELSVLKQLEEPGDPVEAPNSSCIVTHPFFQITPQRWRQNHDRGLGYSLARRSFRGKGIFVSNWGLYTLRPNDGTYFLTI